MTIFFKSEEEKEWFSNRIEGINSEQLTNDEKIEIAKEMIKSQAWDNFLAIKFSMVKRYGGEGAEAMMAFFTELFKLTSQGDILGYGKLYNMMFIYFLFDVDSDSIETIVLGMPHRGKLNVLTGLLGCPPAKIFMKFRGLPEFPMSTKAMCDIAQHFSKFF